MAEDGGAERREVKGTEEEDVRAEIKREVSVMEAFDGKKDA